MLFSFLAATSAITLPAPDPDDILKATDRVRLSQTGYDLSTILLLFVDPDGDVVRCIPYRTRGSEYVARQMCKEARRVQAKPASSRNGDPIHGFISARISVNPDRNDAEDMTYVDHPDLVLPLPSTEFSGMVATIVEVDETGAIVHCEGRTSFDEPSDADKAKVCEYLSTVPLGMTDGRDGVPVRYVRSIKVLVNPQEQ